jgi:hypothetical protein
MVPWSITVVLPQEGWETQLAAKAFGKSEIRSVELIAGGGWVPTCDHPSAAHLSGLPYRGMSTEELTLESISCVFLRTEDETCTAQLLAMAFPETIPQGDFDVSHQTIRRPRIGGYQRAFADHHDGHGLRPEPRGARAGRAALQQLLPDQ